MSKYWNRINIFREDNREDRLFLVEEKVTVFNEKDDCKFITINSGDDLQEISEFYCKNCRILKSPNTIQNSSQDLFRFLNVDAGLTIVKKDEHIIGSIISFLIPISVFGFANKNIHSERLNKIKTKNSFVFACTSYFILEDKFRRKGYGMALIQKNFHTFHDSGGLGSYFINKVSRSNNSISFNTWYFPTNVDNLDICKYPYPKDYKVYFIEKLESFSKIKNDIFLVDYDNCKNAYDFCFQQLEKKKFYFSPSYEYWIKWIESFPTYISYKNGNIVGIFSFNNEKIKYIYSKQNINLGKLLLCLGNQPNTLIDAICKGRQSYDLLNLYDLGDLTSKLLSSVFAQKAQKQYINFYNTSLKLAPSDFYAPIF
jgi:hypothetical protein